MKAQRKELTLMSTRRSNILCTLAEPERNLNDRLNGTDRLHPCSARVLYAAPRGSRRPGRRSIPRP